MKDIDDELVAFGTILLGSFGLILGLVIGIGIGYDSMCKKLCDGEIHIVKNDDCYCGGNLVKK